MKANAYRSSLRMCKAVMSSRKNEICHLWRYLDKQEEKHGLNLDKPKDALTSAVQDMERAINYLEEELGEVRE